MGGTALTTTGRSLDAEGALALIGAYVKAKHGEGASKVKVVPLSGDASTRRYYRLESGGTSYVLALYPEPFQPGELSYLTVHSLLESYGLPVPATHVAGRAASGSPPAGRIPSEAMSPTGAI